MPEGLKCTITITDHAATIVWDPSLQDGPHPVSKAELLAAAAVFGMSQALTARGKRATIRVLEEFERARGGGPDAHR